MPDNHFADVRKKGTMSLTLALIVLGRLNTTDDCPQCGCQNAVGIYEQPLKEE